MAIAKLPVNFQDDVIDTTVSDKRRYNLINNSDGTVSLEDVTTYERIGSMYGAEEINKLNGTVNAVIDESEATSTKLEETNKKISQIAEENKNYITSKMDFILLDQGEITFNNNVFFMEDDRIKFNSLADVYFTADTIDMAKDSGITVDTYDGQVILNCARTPSGMVKATIHIRVV